MPKWTNEQLSAINESGTNIIVSAGAGSGKTAVLSERVIKKLESGIKINELLILTFTNAAASEMKERIRKKISENTTIIDNLDYIESSYITTFDSFCLSLVKKYHYLLNISKNVSIIDSSVIEIIKEKYLDEVFETFYNNEDKEFQKLIKDLCLKNDTELKKYIFNIISSLDNIYDKEEYFNTYFSKYLSEDKIDEYITNYIKLIHKEIDIIEDNLYYIESSMYSDYYNKLLNSLSNLLYSKTYEDILHNINSIKLPRRPTNSDNIKEYKDNIDKSLGNIKDLLKYKDTNSIKESFLISSSYLKVIFKIIKEYYNLVNEYKSREDLYEFIDIELMAIKILLENEEIKLELKNYYKEIMIDEYQDTNDIQEKFISLIENNNVYMVGDIKQSIYGFRNANPYIFKSKYDKYKENISGIKIDLNKNFRSRSNVLSGINEIFSLVMDDDIGGADYPNGHIMNYGNTLYDDLLSLEQNYDLEIYTYQDEKEFSQDEYEAFTIVDDIIDKINNNYQVFDKDTNTLRNANYNDFCIIMDRGTSFNLYKKIFEYKQIPLVIYEDKILTNEYEVLLIKNIITIILGIKNNKLDKNFTYSFISIARSFLFSMPDKEIFNIIKNKTYSKTIIYSKCLDILNKLDTLNNYELLLSIIETFNYYEKVISITGIEDTYIKLDNLYNIARNLSKLGYTCEDFLDYLDKMVDSNYEIKYSIDTSLYNGVKLMNIHKSKGLEFPVCYYSGLSKKFNNSDIKNTFIFTKNFGIITPFYKDGLYNLITKELYKEEYFKENISERIRLFYVALSRAREKMIIVMPTLDNELINHSLVDNNIRLKYNSFYDIINSIKSNIDKYIKEVVPNCKKDYLYNIDISKDINSNIDTLSIKDNNILYKEISLKRASKSINNLITKEEKDTLDYGTKMHKVLEETDFFNIDKDNILYDNITYLVNSLSLSKDNILYKEHEFMYELDNTNYHGIIDLLIEKDNEFIIVDYKLKCIDDPLYKEQLKVYFNYLKSISNKDISMYLYSIIDNVLSKIEI